MFAPSRWLAVFVLTVPSLVALAQHTESLQVAAASDLTSVMDKLGAEFEKQTGIHVAVAFGSSGNFFAQLQNGAPFDVFLSADRSFPEKLAQQGRAEPGTFTIYARGRLALWVPENSRLRFSVHDGVLEGNLNQLADPGMGKIAVANPEHAPYGRAAVAALVHYGIYDRVKSRLVLGENVSQTAQFAESGNADAAFIPLSLSQSELLRSRGHFVLLPAEAYSPIEQAGVVAANSRQKAQARRFLEFLVSAKGQAILRHFGFEAPQP